MIEQQILQQLLASGESQHMEFKVGTTPSETVAAVVCSFLNADGGVLLLGVDDAGAVVGVPAAKRRRDELQRLLTEKLTPPASCSLQVVELSGKACIAIEVPVGSSRPYAFDGRIFVRRREETVVASGEEVSRVLTRQFQGEARWERQVAPGVEFSDLDHEEIHRTFRTAEQRGLTKSARRQSLAQMLDGLRLVANGLPLNSAVVLFAKQPTRWYPQTRLRLACFASNDPGTLVESRVVEGHLFELLRQAEAFLRTHVPMRSTLAKERLQRRDEPVYPWSSVREALLNAVSHRDYAAYDGSVIVSIYPDRLEVWNPGQLPEGMSVDDLKTGTVSRPHNPDIAHVLFLCGYVEQLGIGIRRMIAECSAAGLPEPEWESMAGGIRLTLRQPGSRSLTLSSLNSRQRELVETLAPGERIGTKRYHEQFAANVSERHARYELSQLAELGYLRREGRGPATEYVRTSKTTA